MTVRLHQLEDLEDARAAFTFAMPNDWWPGDEHTVWTARLRGQVCGMMCARHWEDVNVVYLAGAAVPLRYQGRGVYQHMLRYLARWARSLDAVGIVTYTLLHNYESMGGLLKAGFRFAKPPAENQFVGPHVHYFVKPLRKKKRAG